MGNASTKERTAAPNDRHPSRRPNRSNGEGSSSHLGRLSTLGGAGGDVFSSRSSRSRHNLESSLFGLGGSREGRERDREAEKAAREQKRKDREAERQKDRERSRKEESLDGMCLSSTCSVGGMREADSGAQAVSWLHMESTRERRISKIKLFGI